MPKGEREQEKDFLNKLACFQRSGHGDHGLFGCVYREGAYPFDVYFYDEGVYWKTDFSMGSYFNTFLEYKAVAGWQYFFIDAKNIIEKRNGLTCKGWPVTAVDGIDNKPKAFGVLHQMNKIIKLFPDLFPNVDLSYATKKRDELEKLLRK